MKKLFWTRIFFLFLLIALTGMGKKPVKEKESSIQEIEEEEIVTNVDLFENYLMFENMELMEVYETLDNVEDYELIEYTETVK